MAILYDFTVPEAIITARAAHGIKLPKKVTLRELGANDELQAAQMARGAGAYQKSRYDAVKRSIAELDGTPVSYADEKVDQFWEGCGPKVRELLINAYEEFSGPSEDENKDFQKSRKERLA